MEKFKIETNGAEDIDEFAININGVCVHLEKMNKNEYFLGVSCDKLNFISFIGHWPADHKKRGTLKINITENDGLAEWHY